MNWQQAEVANSRRELARRTGRFPQLVDQRNRVIFQVLTSFAAISLLHVKSIADREASGSGESYPSSDRQYSLIDAIVLSHGSDGGGKAERRARLWRLRSYTAFNRLTVRLMVSLAFRDTEAWATRHA